MSNNGRGVILRPRQINGPLGGLLNLINASCAEFTAITTHLWQSCANAGVGNFTIVVLPQRTCILWKGAEFIVARN